MLCLALMLPCAALAEENSIACMPGDTIDAVFQPVFPSGKPDVIVGQLEYDHDLFEGQFAGLMSVTPQGGVYMYNGNAVAVPFRVNRYAPAGTYTISVRVIEARDSQGKLMTDVTVLPVEVTVQKEKSVMPLPTAAPQPTASRPASPEKDFQYEIHDGKATVTGYSGNDAEVVIPEKLGGYPVRVIGYMAFDNNKILSSIIIPDGVETIDMHAFNFCVQLQNIRFPVTLITIDSGAFQSCNSLTGVVLPAGLTTIGDRIFNGCDNLTSVMIPDSVEKCGDNPFRACNNLKEIILSEDHPLLEVKDGVLYNKTEKRLIFYPDSLHESHFSIPFGVEAIGDEAFSFCYHITRVIIPDSVTSIGFGAFRNCGNLVGISIPHGIREIEGWTFLNCGNLLNVSLPENLQSIGRNAFYRCTSLESIIIPESVIEIAEDAFSECSPDLVITVSAGSYALDFCKQNGLKYQIK